jgi:hypothetical protein
VAIPPLQSLSLSGESSLSTSAQSMTAVCPFIEPAARAGLLQSCEIAPYCRTVPEIHPRLFEQLVPVIERYREARRGLEEKQQRLLICHIAILRMPPELDADTARLLNWPNWLGMLLKLLYTPKEIVFGFVRKNIAERSTFGTPIPIAPFHAVIIRSRVVGSDQRFFKGNQPLLRAMMEADDDGQSAYEKIPGMLPDLKDPQSLRDAHYFERARQWGMTVIPRGK